MAPKNARSAPAARSSLRKRPSTPPPSKGGGALVFDDDDEPSSTFVPNELPFNARLFTAHVRSRTKTSQPRSPAEGQLFFYPPQHQPPALVLQVISASHRRASRAIPRGDIGVCPQSVSVRGALFLCLSAAVLRHIRVTRVLCTRAIAPRHCRSRNIYFCCGHFGSAFSFRSQTLGHRWRQSWNPICTRRGPCRTWLAGRRRTPS